MQNYTAEEKAQIEEIRSCLDRIQQACKVSPWVSPGLVLSIKEELSCIREHINTGRSDPSIGQIYNKLFNKNPHLDIEIEELITLIGNKRHITHHIIQDPITQVPLLLISFISWSQYQGRPVTPPANSKLPVTHPDLTDRFGFPVYVAIDDEGKDLDGQDRKALSQVPQSITLRKKYGTVQKYTQHSSSGHGSTVTTLNPVNRPEITPDMRRQYEVASRKVLSQEEKLQWALEQWRTIYIPYRIKAYEEELKTQEAQAKKRGTTVKRVSERVKGHKNQLEQDIPDVGKVKHVLRTMRADPTLPADLYPKIHKALLAIK